MSWLFEILAAVAVLVSGGFEGVMDHLQFHYGKQSQFWNPKISWLNKYRDWDVSKGLTFRGRFLVFTTDGWHLMKWCRNLFVFTGIALYGSSCHSWDEWKWHIVAGVCFWAINRIGFNITYKLL